MVTVSSHQTISITITLSNISSSKITLYRLASPVLEALPPISKIDVLDGNGKTIDYKLDNWKGQGDRHLQLLDINTNDNKKVVISYALDLVPQTYWQVTTKYIAVAENQVFFQPDADRGTTPFERGIVQVFTK